MLVKKTLTIFMVVCLMGGFLIAAPTQAADISAGDLIKASTAAVYYYSSDGGRYCFPNEKTYLTWYNDFSNVKTITDAELADISLYGNVTYKPGVKMIKITTNPKVYVIDAGATLRWVNSEQVAIDLYGNDWNKKIDDVADPFFINYKKGNPVNSSSDFNKETIKSNATNIDVDKGSSPENSNNAPSTTTLSAPSSVTPSIAFTISWTAVTNALNYTLEKSVNQSFSSPSTKYFGANTSINETITSNYYYRVRAQNNIGVSAWSAVIKVEVGCATLVAPTLSTSTNIAESGNNFTVNWTSINGATSYTLERDTNAFFTSATEVTLANQTSVSASQSFLPANTTTYYYRIKTLNDCGYSAWSNTANVQVNKLCTAPSAPTLNDPGISIETNTAFNVSWSTVSEATSYSLQRDDNSSFTSPTTVYTGSSNTTSQNLSAPKTYYYRVKASNDCGESSWSSQANIVVNQVGPILLYVPSNYSTIQAALNAANDGDTVQVSNGTYTENITWPQTNNITLVSANGPSLTIINGSGNTKSCIYVGNNQTGAVIDGFTIQNGYGSLSTFHSSIKFGGGILIDENVTATINNCIIKDNGTGGSEYSGGIFVSRDSNVTVTSCTIKDNDARGIYFRNFASDGLVKNNILTGNGGGGIYCQSSPVEIINNTVSNNTGTGIFFDAPFPIIKNNIITSNSVDGIDANQTDNDGYTIAYNNIWGNSGENEMIDFAASWYTDITIVGNNGNISSNPFFVGGNNYHLQASSPCIDTGDPASSYTNEPAPNGSRINMGAYGNTSGATSGSSGSSFSQSYAGPDTSSAGVELTNFSVTGSNTVGGTLTVQYTYRNTNSYSLDFSPSGIFVGCRDSDGSNVDFGSVQITLSPGESYSFSATKTLNKTGSWHFWPAYWYNGWGPYMWHEIVVPVN